MQYCIYYQAHIPREYCWFLTATLRSYEHVAFDRTLDKEHSIFEFFVPEPQEPLFIQIMSRFEKEGVVQDLKKLPNRFIA
jgi:hypothetical protein